MLKNWAIFGLIWASSGNRSWISTVDPFIFAQVAVLPTVGGIKGAISKTFLRFFDDFRYKKIKLSCKLHNSVCEIGGIKNQDNQFVIVQGGGIPKINIVGYVRSINWEEFVRRLLNANYDN